MFRIKICGVTQPDDADQVVRAGADAIGLNFYPRSPRFLQPEAAQQIVGVVGAAVVKVGLFVNAPPETICDTFDRLGLDLIQLHGNEPVELVGQLGGRPVMRAFRIDQQGLSPVFEYVRKAGQLGWLPKLVLVDACRPGTYGGTGHTVDWSLLEDYPRDGSLPPLVLAGGLTATNVGRAISQVHPWAVDTASGVESSPGRKDPVAVSAFVEAARAAWADPQ